jgi:hypothetical protein
MAFLLELFTMNERLDQTHVTVVVLALKLKVEIRDESILRLVTRVTSHEFFGPGHVRCNPFGAFRKVGSHTTRKFVTIREQDKLLQTSIVVIRKDEHATNVKVRKGL